MKSILSVIKEITCAVALVSIFSHSCLAAEGDALDVFEEFAQTQNPLVCKNFQLNVKKGTALKEKLRYSADGDVQFLITTAPEKGSIEIIGADGEFVYTPFEGQSGDDSFSFRISSLNEESNIAVCTIYIEESHQAEPSPSSIVYVDMNGHWGEYAAVKMVENDIIKGERIGAQYYFYPDKLISRIDVINIILSALDADSITADESNTHIFEDSSLLPDYINNAAYRAHRLGIIEGSEYNGKIYLNPYDRITRTELMKMIDKAMSSKTKSDIKMDFVDFHSVPDWAVQSVKNLVGYGIAEGYEDNTIRPYETVTKAQAVQMIYQMMKYNGQKGVPTAITRIKNGFYSVNVV